MHTTTAIGDMLGSVANSKAVLSAMRTLQDKIRVLEHDRSDLELRLRSSEEAREREMQQGRVLQHQLQLQLRESIKSLTVRHESELEALSRHAQRNHADAQASLQVGRGFVDFRLS